MRLHPLAPVQLYCCLVVAGLAASSVGWAQDNSLTLASKTLSSDKILSLEFEAAGAYYQFSQAPGPGQPWPAFEVRDYVASLDFERGAVHSRYTRLQKADPLRVRPLPVEQKLEQYMMNGITWNVAANGSAQAIPANLAERMAEIWTTPQGFVRAAQQHRAIVTPQPNGEANVAFGIDGFRYEGVINSRGEVIRVRTWMDSPVLGDAPLEWRFLDYRDFDGVHFPARIERIADGFPWYELEVRRVRVNSVQAFAIPTDIERDPVPSVSEVNAEIISPGVFYFTGSSHHSVVIEQAEGIVVIEAPLNEERSLAVIAKICDVIPGKPITHVINTHVHFDHAGGLRTYASEGATIVSAAANVTYLRRAWSNPRTLNPDRLANSGREATFTGFQGKLVLPDDDRPIEVHEIVGSGHSDAFAMVYLPKQKALIQGDAWTPAPAPASSATNPFWLNLYDNIERLKLDVHRIAPLHGTMQSINDLRAAIGK